MTIETKNHFKIRTYISQFIAFFKMLISSVCNYFAKFLSCTCRKYLKYNSTYIVITDK